MVCPCVFRNASEKSMNTHTLCPGCRVFIKVGRRHIVSQDDYTCYRLVLTANSSLDGQELVIFGKDNLPWALNVPVLLRDMQISDCSSPGPFLRVVFTVSTLEGHGNVSLWDKEQLCLLLTSKQHGP